MAHATRRPRSGFTRTIVSCGPLGSFPLTARPDEVLGVAAEGGCGGEGLVEEQIAPEASSVGGQIDVVDAEHGRDESATTRVHQAAFRRVPRPPALMSPGATHTTED